MTDAPWPGLVALLQLGLLLFRDCDLFDTR